jgi:hypothetical protein
MPSPTSPNMGLFLPVPGVTTGPQWATELTTNQSTVDTHDHTSGKGVQIPFAAIVVNADLSFAGFQITSLGAAVLTQLATTSTNLTNQSLTNVLGQPYWRDNAGVNKKIILTGDALSLPSGTAASGYLQFTAVAAPATPGAGLARVYVDSTSKMLAVINDAGAVGHTAQSRSVVTNNFLTGLNDNGAFTAAQPAFSNLSGAATAGQLPSFGAAAAGIVPASGGGTANFLRADGTWAAAGATNLTGDVTSVGAATTYNNTVPIAKGGTGQTTALPGIDALRAGAFATIASAATTDLSTTNTETVSVTGSVNISSLGTVTVGAKRRIIFSGGGGLLINSANLQLPGASNPQVNAGDVYEFVSLGSGAWKCTGYSSSTCGIALNSNQVSLISSGVNAMFAAGSIIHTTGGSTLVSDGGRWQSAKGASIASATTITLGNDGNVFPVTGTTAITGITTTSWQAGSIVTLVTASAVNLGHLTTAGGIRTKTGAAVTTVAGNAYMLVYDGTTWDLL